jgi:hypothetical protein
MKATMQSPNMTSFHGQTFRATVNEIREFCGVPDSVCRDSSDKVQFDWVFETEDGRVFTIYDWKEYRLFGEDETIEWHIGAHDSYTASTALTEILEALNS